MKKTLGIIFIVIAFGAIAMHSLGHALWIFQYAFMLLTHHVVMIGLGLLGLYLLLKGIGRKK